MNSRQMFAHKRVCLKSVDTKNNDFLTSLANRFSIYNFFFFSFRSHRHKVLEMENNVNDSTAANKSYQANATNESMMTLETSDNDAIDNLCDISSLSIGDGAPVVVFDDANKKQQSLNECERNDAIKTETKSTNTTIRMCKKCNCLCDTNAMEKRAVNKTSSMPPSIRVRGNDKCIEPCSFDISEIELNPCATKTETETEIIDPTKNENENQLRNFVNNSSKLPIIVDETLSSTSPPKSLPLITTTPISTNPIDKQNYHPTTYLPSHIRNLPKTQSLDLADSELPGLLPKMHSFDQTRPIYPNVPFSPYGSPFGSPRIGRRRPPLRESRRISIEQMGSFLQLNQYKLMDQIGQVRHFSNSFVEQINFIFAHHLKNRALMAW